MSSTTVPPVIGGDRLRDAPQQHRLAGARRRDDEAALALPIGVRSMTRPAN
jgi:hypothetical protein